MRNRIIAVLLGTAAALGAFALIVLAVGYNGTIAHRPDDSNNSLVGMDQLPQTDGSTNTPVPIDVERLHAHGTFLDDCMADAGFPEYRAVGPWDPEWVVGTPDWDADFSDTKAAAAALALWGSPGAGADYRWEDAGCGGYATHMIGADNES